MILPVHLPQFANSGMSLLYTGKCNISENKIPVIRLRPYLNYFNRILPTLENVKLVASYIVHVNIPRKNAATRILRR